MHIALDPCTYVLLPSGKLLQCDEYTLSQTCEALDSYELADRTVVLNYPASCQLQDSDVTEFFGWLHKLSLFGGVLEGGKVERNWCHLIAALQCPLAYGPARAELWTKLNSVRSFHDVEEPLGELVEWLSVGRHEFLELSQGQFLQELFTSQLARVLRDQQFVRCITPLSFVQLTMGVLLRGPNCRICHADRPDIVVPRQQWTKMNQLAPLVERRWGIPRDKFQWARDEKRINDYEYYGRHWDSVLVEELDQTACTESGTASSTSAPPADAAVPPSPSAELDSLGTTVVCKGAMGAPQVVLVVGSIKVVCRARLVAWASSFVREIVQDWCQEQQHQQEQQRHDDSERSAQQVVVAEIPLPALARLPAADVVEFFRHLHSQSLCARDRSTTKLLHWRPSWVHIVSCLQMEQLFNTAISYIWDELSSDRCRQNVARFCECIEASKLPGIRNSEWRSMAAKSITAFGPFRLGIMLSEPGAQEQIATTFGDECGAVLAPAIIHYARDAAERQRSSY